MFYRFAPLGAMVLVMGSLALAKPHAPQNVPQEIPLVVPAGMENPQSARCQGCDCPFEQCFTPNCDCRLPASQAWGTEMLAQLQRRLARAFHKSSLSLEQEPMFILKVNPRLSVIEPRYLAKFGTDQVQGYYGSGHIRISSELSRRAAITVLAHELGHAWQAENNPLWQRVDPFLSEGFAEWVAYSALRCYGDGASAYKIRSSGDVVYGGGLRYFLDLERQGGAPLIFEIARTWLDGKGNKVPPPPPKATPTPEPTPTDE